MKKAFYVFMESGPLSVITTVWVVGKIVGIIKYSWTDILIGIFSMYISFLVTYVICFATDKDGK